MSAKPDRALDRNEAELVAQAASAGDHTDRELTELIRKLRARRDRVQRMIRTRARSAQKKGETQVDTGAREKKAQLVGAIEAVDTEIKRRKSPGFEARQATQNLREAVDRKDEAHRSGDGYRTADTGPVEIPNEQIPPSGAFHAEGHRPALGRSRGR